MAGQAASKGSSKEGTEEAPEHASSDVVSAVLHEVIVSGRRIGLGLADEAKRFPDCLRHTRVKVGVSVLCASETRARESPAQLCPAHAPNGRAKWTTVTRNVVPSSNQPMATAAR